MNAEVSLPADAQAVEAGESAEGAVEVDATQREEGAQDLGEDKPKPEKTPEQREIERLRRGIDRRTRQIGELRAQLTAQPTRGENDQQQDDSERLSLTRAELDDLIATRANELAPRISAQQTEAERRTAIVQSLSKAWGQEKFDIIARDLNDVFEGLTDAQGRPKPATEALFEAKNPAAVIEYLADPEHADEAERIARLGAVKAGMEIRDLEERIKAASKPATPKASNVAAPLEPARSGGKATTDGPDPSDTKAWIRWRNEQERKGL